MKNYAALLKLTLRNRWATLCASMMRKDEKRIHPAYAVLMLVAFLGFAVLAGGIAFAEVALSGMLFKLGQASLMPALTLLISFVCTLMFSAVQTLSSLYFSRDSSWLASLPVRNQTVFAVRMSEIYLSEILLNAVILSPALIVYAMHDGSMLCWLRTLIILLLSACIPVALNVLLASVLARFTALSRHKEVVVTFASVLMVALILTLELSVLPSIPDDAGVMFFVEILLGKTELMHLLTASLPTIRWAVNGLCGSWTDMLLFTAASIGSVAAVLLIMGPHYLEVCIRQEEHGHVTRKKAHGNHQYVQRSPLAALYMREWSELLRTPAYLLNGTSSIIMMPLMALFILIGMSSDMPLADVLSEVRKMIARIQPQDLLLILTAIMGFACLINPAAATSITREGKHHDLYRMMPISPWLQLKSKLLTGMTLAQLGMLTTMAVAMIILGNLHCWLALAAFMLATPFNLAVTCAMITIDAAFPNYHWVNETQAIKQSMNSMWGMLAGIVLLLIPGGIWFVTAQMLHLKGIVPLLCTMAVLLGETAGCWLLLRSIGRQCYSRSEG